MVRTVLARVVVAGRAFLLGLTFLLAAIVLPVAWSVGNVVLHARAQAGVPAVPAVPTGLPAPAFDPSLRTAVVITGNGGAEMTDFLIPYEALATTEQFNMYVVAPERRVVPLANAAFRDGGLELVPHFGLADFDRTIARTPDVIVIPFLPAFADGEEQALVPWLRRHADNGALILSICAGSEVLAATGLVDGQRATTHPNFLARLEASYPAVTWVRDVRYVETARTISSGAIASGMDATLAAIRRLLGRAAAEDVARTLGYAHARFLDDPASPAGFAWGAFAGAAVSPLREELGVLVHDGVSEVALGSVFDTYPTTLASRVRSIGTRAGVIPSRHGLWLLPRATLATVGDVDRVIVPGASVPAEVSRTIDSWATSRDVEATFVHAGRSGFAYDGPLADLAARDGRIVAAAVAINLNYPIDHLALEGAPVPAIVVVVPLLLSALGVMALVWIRRRLRTRRARRAARTTLGELRPSGAAG